MNIANVEKWSQLHFVITYAEIANRIYQNPEPRMSRDSAIPYEQREREFQIRHREWMEHSDAQFIAKQWIAATYKAKFGCSIAELPKPMQSNDNERHEIAAIPLH